MQYFANDSVKNNIDFDYVLKKIKVSTPYGDEYKRQLTPFMPGQEAMLRNELGRIDKLVKLINEKGFVFRNLQSYFSHIKDLRNSVSGCIKGNILTVVELFEIKNFLLLIRDIERELSNLNWNIPEDILVEYIPNLMKIFDPTGEGVRTFYIYDEYSRRLKEIRNDKKFIDKEIREEKRKIREKLKEELRINIKPNGDILVSKAEGEMIKRVSTNPFLAYSSETYMNIKYTIKSTDKIDSLEIKLQKLKDEEDKEEYKIRTMLSQEIANYSDEIFKNMDAIGKLDLTIAKAYMAIKIKGVKPEIKDSQIINIIEGRHLRVEETLKQKNQKFIPVSANLKQGIICITGANMGGKTVSLKMIGLLAAMTQYGLFVPCTAMEMGLHEFIHISTGDLQSTDMGLSTFGAEIKGIQDIISRKDQRGLILIDELARGTNPEEGYAISKGIVNFFKDRTSITVITTHYDNVANTNGVVHLQVIGLANVDYEELKSELKNNDKHGINIVCKYMDYRLRRVLTKEQVPRDAINIARLMGLDESIVRDAEKTLGEN